MDSMLVPVTKVVGRELGLVALIVGIVLDLWRTSDFTYIV